MAAAAVFRAGGYRYLKGLFQHSAGVAAEPGFAVERARLSRPLPLSDGFALLESHLRVIGRPTTALAACELRSPQAFSEQEFAVFNRRYVGTLERWGLMDGEATPVARSNVCPEHDRPAEPSLYAFSYTVPAQDARASFVLSGAVEAPDGKDVYTKIVRPGETSTAAMREKMRYVSTKLEQRLQELGLRWQDALATQVYTVQDIGALAPEMAAAGYTAQGLLWHFCRPPVPGLEFEMDVRATAREIVL